MCTRYFVGFSSNSNKLSLLWHFACRCRAGSRTDIAPKTKPLEPNHYLKQCWLTVNWFFKRNVSKISLKIRNFLKKIEDMLTEMWLPFSPNMWMMTSGMHTALMVPCEDNPPVTGGLPSQSPVMRSFLVCVVDLNQLLNKQSRHRWFETRIWRHCYVMILPCSRCVGGWSLHWRWCIVSNIW